MIFAGIALKLEKVGPAVSSFNSCPSLPLDDRKQFQCLNIYWTIFDSIDEKTSLRYCLHGGGRPQIGELTCDWSSPIM